jgi:hypothetical protein
MLSKNHFHTMGRKNQVAKIKTDTKERKTSYSAKQPSVFRSYFHSFRVIFSKPFIVVLFCNAFFGGDTVASFFGEGSPLIEDVLMGKSSLSPIADEPDGSI